MPLAWIDFFSYESSIVECKVGYRQAWGRGAILIKRGQICNLPIARGSLLLIFIRGWTNAGPSAIHNDGLPCYVFSFVGHQE